MSNFFECFFWWLLFGLFLGFLLFWLYDKLFRRDGEERVTALESQLAALRAERDRLAVDLNQKSEALDAQESSGRELSSAAKFGFSPMKDGEDNLTLIEGIGPKISSILKQAGYRTFQAVSEAEVDTLQKLLDNAGPAFKLAKPGSWPKQAGMAAGGQWEKLKHYQDNLVNGIEFDD